VTDVFIELHQTSLSVLGGGVGVQSTAHFRDFFAAGIGSLSLGEAPHSGPVSVVCNSAALKLPLHAVPGAVALLAVVHQPILHVVLKADLRNDVSEDADPELNEEDDDDNGGEVELEGTRTRTRVLASRG